MGELKTLNDLTPEQIAAMPKYRDKWTKISFSTEPCDREKNEKGVKLAYELAGLTPPHTIIWKDSPIAGAITAYCLAEGIDPDSVDYANPPKDLLEKAKEQIWQACYGQHDANWLATYDFFRNEMGLKDETAKLEGLLNIDCGWWWPFEEVCVMTERHCDLHMNAQGQLHREGGPAVKYVDGFALYFLNGVRVPKWLAETPTDDLDPKRVLNLRNVDQRREGVRRIGHEKMLSKMDPKVLDRQKDIKGGEYVLYALSVESGEPDFRYLKMDNPSIKAVHIEGVPFDIDTVQEALNWRATQNKARAWNPSQLS